MVRGELVSVIIPVYNAEAYLNRCLESVVEQSYSELEILLIDDGSTDASGLMCEQWAERDARILAVHQENAGVASARNKGLELCRGEWIVFVDSDDYIHKEYVRQLLNLNRICGTMMSGCEAVSVKGSDKTSVSREAVSAQSRKMSSSEFMRSPFYCYTVWHYMYNKCLFKGIRFPAGKLSEDFAVVYKLLYEAREVAFLDEALYYHVLHDGSLSISRESITQCDVDRIDILKEQAAFFEEKGEATLAELAWKNYAITLLSVYDFADKHPGIFAVKREELVKEYREHIKKIIKNDTVSFKMRVLLICSYVYPKSWGILTGNK